ncbi:MAG: hypothetical protein ACR2GA_02470 [Chloroflexota bacterium]
MTTGLPASNAGPSTGGPYAPCCGGGSGDQYYNGWWHGWVKVTSCATVNIKTIPQVGCALWHTSASFYYIYNGASVWLQGTVDCQSDALSVVLTIHPCDWYGVGGNGSGYMGGGNNFHLDGGVVGGFSVGSIYGTQRAYITNTGSVTPWGQYENHCADWYSGTC